MPIKAQIMAARPGHASNVAFARKIKALIKKTKKKNILTALTIIAFMIFLFVFTLYNVGVFDRQL